MSYLPSSRIYEGEIEAPARTDAKPERKRAPATVLAEPPASPPVVTPPVVSVTAPPPQATPPPVAPTPPRPVMMGSKEWLVAPAPTLHVEASTAETVTMPASSSEELPGRKRNLFHRAQKVVLRHLNRAKDGAKNARSAISGEPDLLWWAVMATGSLCMGLVIWGAYSALPRFGNSRSHLRPDPGVTRLTGTYVAPFQRVHETGTIRPQQHPMPHPQPHPAPPAPPFVPPPPPNHDARPHEPLIPTERPLAALPERREPVVFVNANLGETPMTRTWKKIAESTVLLATFTAAASNNLLAQQPQVDYSKQIADLTKAVQTLSDQFNAVNDKIAKIKLEPRDNSADFQILANRLDRLEKLLAAGAAGGPAPIPVAGGGNLDEIKLKLGSIEQAILKLQPAESRIALAPPSANEPPIAARAGTSQVVFVNLYNQDLLVLVNQKQHRAPAGTTLTLNNIPSGQANVEVRSSEGFVHKSNPTLVANETFTLTAR